MENQYQYFKRDISWLSFNYRVLLEAEDDTLPLYERINFISFILPTWKNSTKYALPTIKL